MIINLTQHDATPDQIEAGVIDLTGADKSSLVKLLTIEDLPTVRDLIFRAEKIAELADRSGFNQAMIGGAPYLMRPLEDSLIYRDIAPVYAFSQRRAIDEKQPDGTVKKSMVFKHLGFVKP